MHPLFPYFRNLCRLLESHGISYFLAGGTLLGAVRDGNLIAHDYDFDIDCLMDDRERILALDDELAAINLKVKHRFYPAEKMVAVNDEVRPGEERSLSSLKVIEAKTGKVLGDIYLFTIFRDGIARRHDLATGAYCNAKMSLPAWYYEAGVPLTVGGETFSAPRDPELLAEKIYGPDWRTPLKSGEFAGERTKSSGSVLDADRERLVWNALQKGWDGDYSDKESWPPTRGFVINKQSVTWAKAHEPMFVPALAKFFTNETVERASKPTSAFRTGQYLRYFVSRAWYEHTVAASSYQAKLAKQKVAMERLSAELRAAQERIEAQAAEIGKMAAERAQVIPEKRVGNEGVRSHPRELDTPSAEASAAPIFPDSPAASPSIWKSVVGKLLRRSEPGGGAADEVRMIRESGFFDPVWYLARYPDVASANIDPATHFFRNGARERRDPGPKFSTRRYLAEHPEVEETRMNPLLHYLLAEKTRRSVSSAH